MPEKRDIITIKEITDDDTGLYYIGEIDGIYDSDLLMRHIKSHGSDGLITYLAHLQFIVVGMQYKINKDNELAQMDAIPDA